MQVRVSESAPDLRVEGAGAVRAPASYAQRQFWLLDRLTGGHPVYHAPKGYHLRGPLDVPALERVLGEIARRHAVLRTRLPERDGALVQEILPPRPFRLRVADLASETEAGRERGLAAIERQEVRGLFDLDAGPTWRAALARLGPEEHVLFLTFHHVAFDGWSRTVLERELGALYGAFSRGRPSPLEELAFQYAEYAEWEREQLSGERLERLLAYWTERLSDVPPLDLPTDRPRPPRATFDGAVVRFEVPSPVTCRLRAYAASRKATPFMVALAAFQALLHRLSGADDVPVGCPTAGRSRRGTEDLIGCFINPVVLRGDLSGDPTFAELVEGSRRSTIEALSHAELRFELLVERLRPERVQGMNPLFQVLFQVRNYPPPAMEMAPGLTVDSRLVDHGGSTVDMAWSLDARGDGYDGQVEYDIALFDERTVRRMCERFVRVLDRALADPATPLSALPLLGEAERRRIDVEWNQTSTPYPREKSIVELFEEQVARDPEAVAIRHGGVVVRYGELDARARRLAASLGEAGIEPGALVGLCLGRSVELIVGMVAALRAGAAYVPLDPDYPGERLAFMSEDAGIGAIVVEPGGERPAVGAGIPVVASDAAPSDPAPAGSVRPTGPDDLAYVLYTSGSTGRPKGVAVGHRAVVRLVRDTDYVSIGPGDRVAHASNPSFDATTFEVWGALLNGASVVILDPDVALEPPRLARELRAAKITELFLTTALFNAVADEVPDAFRPLRTVMFGGEAVDPARVRKVLEGGPPERLLHVYGPTECTTFATWHRVTEVPATATTVPIGRPIANTRAWVVDRHGGLVPPGVAGELLLGGDGLARGYHRRPDLTRRRFVDAPFGSGERVYRTGDRVRREEDGAIVFLGRSDRQLKLRGFRIEPGEIEAALASHPSVRECVVAPREVAPGDRRLVAWLVADGNPPPSSAELGAFLGGRLPRYMLPSAYVVVEAMPLNRNGKLDVAALPDPRFTGSAAGPLTETESLLAEVWREALGVPEVGRTDDFYDLGGHSLLAVRLFSDIEERTGCRLPVSLFTQELTIAAMAESLERETAIAGTDFLVSIRPEGSRPPLFLVHGGGGHVFVYRWLAPLLDEDQPVFGFALKGLRRAAVPRTVEEMAECYLEDLEVLWPEGPCVLGGYSFGGVVAWEMARRLRARGRDVPLLVLLEATPELFQALPARVRIWRRSRWRAGRMVRALASVLPDAWGSVLPSRFRVADRGSGRGTAADEESERMMAISRSAARSYRPGRYAGRVLYLRSVGQKGRSFVWPSLCDDLEVVMIPSSGHASFLHRADVRAVAQALDPRLREALVDEAQAGGAYTR